MAFQEIIAWKRDGHKFDSGQIREFIDGYVNGDIPDYQASALLMAIYFQGMDAGETFHLTDTMMRSGRILDLSAIGRPKIDKHSTGGVGDKVSLMLAPMAAACGLAVPMISGRGLGHTGGTLDKLESIPGYRTDLSVAEFIDVIDKCGVSIIGQTGDIVPADKKIYALRDVTATVESIPLITASILSKKIASGTDGIVFDVKFGNGAFMKTVDKAKQLAESLVMTAKKFNKKCRAVLTSMEQPLGSAVGNSLEVLETIEFLKGDRADDLNKVVMALGAQMLLIGGIAESPHEAERLLELSIVDGKALQKFAEMVRLHGGNPDIVEDSSLLKTAPVKQAFTATRDGYISGFETMKIGLAVNGLGAGRNRIAGPNGGDRIDPGVGFKIYKKIGDFLRRGDTIAEIFAACQSDAEKALDELSRAVSITDSPPKSPNIIYEIIPLLSG